MTAAEDSLRSVQGAFRNAAYGRHELRHSIFVTSTCNPADDPGPVRDRDSGHGINGGLDYTFKYASDKWWQCRFHIDPAYREYVADPFWGLARAAGAVAKELQQAQVLLEDRGDSLIGDEDIWTIVIYKLAFQETSGSPLRCRVNRLTDTGRDSIDVSQALLVPVGLHAELTQDPFTASVYAIDILLSGESPGEVDQHNIFRKSGEIWTVRFSGKEIQLQNHKGLAYINRLLQTPEITVSVEELEGQRGVEDQWALDETSDPEARADYANRIRDLEDEVEAARTTGDTERADKAMAEMAQVRGSLRMSRKGKSVRLDPEGKRRCMRVGGAMNAAIKQIAKNHPELGWHFEESIKSRTGKRPRYDPQVPTEWDLG